MVAPPPREENGEPASSRPNSDAPNPPGDDAPQPQVSSESELAPDQVAESKAYGREKLHCTLVDMGIDLAFLLLLTIFLAAALDQWLLGFPWLQNRWLRLGVYFLVVVSLHAGVSFPVACHSGFVLEHKYGLSRQSLLRWLGRYALQLGLAAALGLLLIEGLFALVWFCGGLWWLAAAGASFVVNVLLGQLAPVLILPLFYKVERLDDGELASRFDRLAKGTGLAIEGVYRMQLSRETVKANAMLAGLGRTRRVILGDTLLDGFTPEEIEVVLAHEIGHHVFRHISKFLLGGLAFSLAAFFLCDLVLRWYLGGGDGGLDYGSVPVYVLPLLMLMITLFSLLVGPLRNVISRRFEVQCDRYALRRTGLRAEFRAAFCKLATLNKADPNPHPWEVFLFHDHPTIAQRLALADEEESD